MHPKIPLKLQYLINPIPKFTNPRVDSRLVWLRASYPPGDDTGEQEPLVAPLDDHGASRVPFTTVEAAATPPGAYKDVRDVLYVTGVSVHRLAHVILDNRDRHLLQDARERAIWNSKNILEVLKESRPNLNPPS